MYIHLCVFWADLSNQHACNMYRDKTLNGLAPQYLTNDWRSLSDVSNSVVEPTWMLPSLSTEHLTLTQHYWDDLPFSLRLEIYLIKLSIKTYFFRKGFIINYQCKHPWSDCITKWRNTNLTNYSYKVSNFSCYERLKSIMIF